MPQPPTAQKKPTPRPAPSAPPSQRQANTGDSISGSIGDNARGAAIGKNIFQNIIVIGTLKIPVLPVLVLILLVLAAIAFFGLRLLGPAKMTGTFNLAVAEFGQVDSSGKVVSSALGDQISQRLFQGLKIELENLSPADRANFQPQVWQDSLPITQKRVKIGVVPGKTPQERWAAACRLAQTINARVVIYGNLPAGSSAGEFIPEFAVCDNPSLRLDADEIVGSHQLIQGLSLQLLSQLGQPNADLAVNMQVNSWTEILSLFSIGILYDLQGRSDLALATFQQARDNLGAVSNGGAGEVLWFFIGREELILSNPVAAAANSAPSQSTHLANAEAAFQQSLKLNPAYARSHLGLGSVYFSRAQNLSSQDRLKTSDLADAISQYQQALAGAFASAGALIDVKARLGLASTWILQGEAQRDQGQLAQAGDSFAQAVQAASESLQPLIAAQEYRVLAQAYLTLGEAYHEQGHLELLQGNKDTSRAAFENASANYARCIQQKDAAVTDQTLAEKIVASYCVPYKQSADSSLAELK
jgi:tetratricopeptide (TPR) repeat protein